MDISATKYNVVKTYITRWSLQTTCFDRQAVIIRSTLDLMMTAWRSKYVVNNNHLVIYVLTTLYIVALTSIVIYYYSASWSIPSTISSSVCDRSVVLSTFSLRSKCSPKYVPEIKLFFSNIHSFSGVANLIPTNRYVSKERIQKCLNSDQREFSRFSTMLILQNFLSFQT